MTSSTSLGVQMPVSPGWPPLCAQSSSSNGEALGSSVVKLYAFLLRATMLVGGKPTEKRIYQCKQKL